MRHFVDVDYDPLGGLPPKEAPDCGACCDSGVAVPHGIFPHGYGIAVSVDCPCGGHEALDRSPLHPVLGPFGEPPF